MCSRNYFPLLLQNIYSFFSLEEWESTNASSRSQSASFSCQAVLFTYLLALVSRYVFISWQQWMQSSSTRITVFCDFPDYFHFLILKKEKVSHNRKRMCKIQNFLDATWQLFYLYVSAYIWGVLVILTMRPVTFMFHCHPVTFLFNKLGNWS